MINQMSKHAGNFFQNRQNNIIKASLSSRIRSTNPNSVSYKVIRIDSNYFQQVPVVPMNIVLFEVQGE